MATRSDSEGFVYSPLEGQGVCLKDSYCLASEADEDQFRAADSEYRKLKSDFERIARSRRQRSHSKSESSRSPSPVRQQSLWRSANLPKFKIATFYATDVELWFNHIETQFDLHHFTDDGERYSLTCAALSGEVVSDVRDVLLQPFRTNKYESLKGILIERRGLTTPERVNKVISGVKIGTDIPSRFLRRLQKTAGFGTKAVVCRAVIRQAFIRQMLASIRTHLATQPDSASLESLAMLADRALASENDVDESKPGVAEIKVSETGKLVGLTSTMAAEKRTNTGRARTNDNRTPRAQYVQAQPFIPNTQGSLNNHYEARRPNLPPLNASQKNTTTLTDTGNTPVCYYHQTFGDKARTCRDPCAFSLNNHYEARRPNLPPLNASQKNTTTPTDTGDTPVCYYHQTFGDKSRTCRDPCAFSLKC